MWKHQWGDPGELFVSVAFVYISFYVFYAIKWIFHLCESCVPFLPGKNCQSLFSPKTLHFMAEPSLSSVHSSFIMILSKLFSRGHVCFCHWSWKPTLFRCLPKLFQILILIAVVSDIWVSKDGWGGARMNMDGLGAGGELGSNLGGDPDHLYQMFQVIWINYLHFTR